MQKYIYLNIGLNNTPEGTTMRDIMDSLAYSFDVKPLAWAHTWGQYEGQDEPTLVVAFNCDPIPDSTILTKLEAMCTELNQDSIAYELSINNEVYVQGLAWHPRATDKRYLFNPDYFIKLSDTEKGAQIYTSENVPAAGKYNSDKLIAKFN